MQLIPEKKFRTETLGLSGASFWRLKKAGKLPVPVIIGRRNFYTLDSIKKWMEAKKKDGLQLRAGQEEVDTDQTRRQLHPDECMDT